MTNVTVTGYWLSSLVNGELSNAIKNISRNTKHSPYLSTSQGHHERVEEHRVSCVKLNFDCI